jgi:histidine phosphotransferase ChpT
MTHIDMARGNGAAIHRHDMALAQDLAARLCHDLAGCAGTVAGLLDIARDPGEAAEALAAAREAAGHLLRLRLTQAACANADAWDPGAWPALAASVADPRFRVTLDTAAASCGHAPALGILLLNVLLLASEAVRGRGGVALEGAPDGRLTATLAGPVGPSSWPDLAAVTAGGCAGARDFQRVWTLQVAAEADIRLSASGARLDIVPPT